MPIAISDKAATLFDILENEVIVLGIKWGQWRLLFHSEDKSRKRLMCDTAPQFFLIFRESVFYDVVGSLIRLLDPPHDKFAPEGNVSFKALLHEAPDILKPTLLATLNEFEAETIPMKAWRNKRLSHNDLAHLREVAALPEIPFDDITNSIRKAGDILNVVNLAMEKDPVLYHTGFMRGGSVNLLNYLKVAHNHLKGLAI